MANGLLGQLVRPTRQARSRAQTGLQTQQAIAQVPAGQPGTTQLAQQLGANLAQLQAQRQAQGIAQTAGQQLQQAQLAGARRAEQLRQQTTGLEMGARETQAQAAQQLAEVSERAKQELFDVRRQFEQDELGRKFSNEMQLSDFMRLTAKSDEDFRNYQQNLELASERKSKLLSTALSKIEAQLQGDSQLLNQLQDQISSKALKGRTAEITNRLYEEKLRDINVLQQARQNLEIELQEQRAKSAARMARNQAIGSLAGAGIGAIAGGAPGAMAGSTLGGAAGTLA